MGVICPKLNKGSRLPVVPEKFMPPPDLRKTKHHAGNKCVSICLFVSRLRRN